MDGSGDDDDDRDLRGRGNKMTLRGKKYRRFRVKFTCSESEQWLLLVGFCSIYINKGYCYCYAFV